MARLEILATPRMRQRRPTTEAAAAAAHTPLSAVTHTLAKTLQRSATPERQHVRGKEEVAAAA
eukprot:COSAG01_NODE_45948_length_404_cov_3.767213_1_plen_62_part_10